MKRWLSFLLAAVMLITGMLTICSFAAQSEAQTFLSLLNQRRSAQGLATLGTDGGLMDAAAVRAAYAGHIVEEGPVDPALATDMGDYMFLACFPTMEEVTAFYDRVLAEK